MSPALTDRFWCLVQAFLLLTNVIGCESAPSDDAAGALGAGDGGGKAPIHSGDSGAGTTSADKALNAVPFEEIRISSDTSFQTKSVPAGVSAGEVCELTPLQIKFCWCPSGKFLMGSEATDPAHLLNESQFEAILSNGFWLQQTEVTQSQYEAVMGINPSHFKGDLLPAESITWTEANEFCRRVSSLPAEKAAGNIYRLPTEAEWEYACRAGSTSSFCFGDDETQLEKYAWFHKNSAQSTHSVGGKLPNAWGLHDMHGNVMEWCNDSFGDYPSGSVVDPKGADSGSLRSIRGGGWFFVPLYARSSHRDAYAPGVRYVGLGFRMVIPAATPAMSPDQL